MKPTLLSLFAGIGGLDLAAHWAGFETVRFVEKEPFCQKVLAKHWPNVPIDDDVFTSHPDYADVVCGGFPCQPFSVAGNRQGANDERYLLPEMLRIVSEVKPYAVLFENVPGFPSLNDGNEFKFLLRTLTEMGFNAEWGHLRASDIGAPHSRERWFCVAYANFTERKTRRANGMGTGKSSESFTRYGELADPASSGCGARLNNRDERYLLPNGEFTPPHNEEWNRFQRGTRAFSPIELGNTTGAGLERGNRCEPSVGEHTRPNYGRQTQSRFRRTAHGLPGRLDFVGFPARPGQPQYAYEPPRTAPSTPTTNARIKALGNAVVPAVAYPLFAAIVEWLTEVKEMEIAA